LVLSLAERPPNIPEKPHSRDSVARSVEWTPPSTSPQYSEATVEVDSNDLDLPLPHTLDQPSLVLNPSPTPTATPTPDYFSNGLGQVSKPRSGNWGKTHMLHVMFSPIRWMFSGPSEISLQMSGLISDGPWKIRLMICFLPPRELPLFPNSMPVSW